jgi:hypothetical protein
MGSTHQRPHLLADDGQRLDQSLARHSPRKRRGRAQRVFEIAWEKFPQHFAVILLGSVTGLRPSSL